MLLAQRNEIDLTCEKKFLIKYFMWIARDFDGSLWIFTDKPYKDGLRWRLPIGDGSCQPLLECLFPEVHWTDDRPTEIRLIR